jgi:hypothetical protein
MILRGQCDAVVLNRHTTEDKSDDTKNVFYKELEHVFDKFLKYHINILLGDFSAKVAREDVFKPIIRKESLHEINYDNGVRVLTFATSKNLIVKSTMFPHHSAQKYIRTSPDRKAHNQIGHVVIKDSIHV